MQKADAGRNGNGWFTRERVLVLVLAFTTAVVFYVCYLLVLPFAPALIWALAIAIVAHPLHEWIQRRIKRRSLAAALAVVAVTLTIVTPAVVVIHLATNEATASAETMKEMFSEGRWRDLAERNQLLAAVIDWVEREVRIGQQMQGIAEGVLGGAKQVVSRSIYAATGMLITLFLLFYFFRDKDSILATLRGSLPLSPRESEKVFQNVEDTIHAIVFGTLLVSLVQGALGGIMFWGLGLPAPLLWGAVMGLLAILPVLGAAVVWIPAAAYLLFEGSWEKALILTAWGGLVVGLIDNLLYPIFVKNRLRLHTVPVFISVLGGLAAFGAAGIVLGPLVLAIAVGLVDVWRRRMQHGEAVEDSTDARHAAPPIDELPARRRRKP
jgi:predicted PurR-regulated permease PerM